MGGKTPTIDGPTRPARPEACQVPERRPQPEHAVWPRSGARHAMGPGEYRHLTRVGAQYASGLSVGVFFTPTGCLTASAGRGAEPHGFNLATEAE